MSRVVAVTVFCSLFGCDQALVRDDAQTTMEDASVDPSTAPAEGGLAGDEASPDATAASESDASVPATPDAQSQMADASLPAPTDAASDADTSLTAPSDAGRSITYADVQPIFWAKCTPCHLADAGSYAPFAESYDSLRLASKLCPGEVVATCIPRAVEIEAKEGSGCRTFGKPFHREAWRCLTGEERAAILGWQEPAVGGP